MPLCRDLELVLPFLKGHLPGSSSLYYRATGAAGSCLRWTRVDDLARPHAVLARSDFWLLLYATDGRAAARVVAEVPCSYRLRFGATPLRFREVIRRNWPRPIRRKGGWVEECYMYFLKPGRLVVYREHRVSPLRLEDAPLITKHWPHGKNVNYIRRQIRSAPGCGIRRGGRLVAWALAHGDGSMGFLHVLDEFRGRGMARTLTTALARRLLAAGINPFLFIVKGNRPSIRMTESMGFTRCGEYGWFGAD